MSPIGGVLNVTIHAEDDWFALDNLSGFQAQLARGIFLRLLFRPDEIEEPAFPDCYPYAGIQIAGNGHVLEYDPLHASVYAAVPYDGPTNWLDRMTLGFAREDAVWNRETKEYFDMHPESSP